MRSTNPRDAQRETERDRADFDAFNHGRKRYARHKTGGAGLKFIRVVSGNTLLTGETGVKYVSSLITAVPSLYDPTVTSSFIDGIGRGDLWGSNGVFIARVLFVLDPSCPLGRALIVDDVFTTYTTKDIPVTASSDVVSAYIPLFV